MNRDRGATGFGDRGFTLIELVVVLFILGLLIAAALPSYNTARQTAARDEARAIGQEWRELEWSCTITMGNAVTGSTCNNDTANGFVESNVANWNFASKTTDGGGGNSDVYIINVNTTNTTVLRCAPAKNGTAVAGMQYQQYLIVSGTGAGSSSDVFVSGPHTTCP